MGEEVKIRPLVGTPPTGLSGSGSFLSFVAYAVIAVCAFGGLVAYEDIGYAAIAVGVIGVVQGAMLLAFASMANNLARIEWILSTAAVPAKP
jgi:hypothetical protein